MPQDYEAIVVSTSGTKVVNNSRSPWEKLNFYQQNVQKYLQANESQLARLTVVDTAALKHDSFLMDHNTDELDLATFQHDIRSDLSSRCQDLRSSVESLAVDVAEIIQHRSQADQEKEMIVLQELQATAHSVKDKFEEMRQFFLKVFGQHKDSTVTHLANMNTSNILKWTHLFGGVCFGTVGVWSLCSLISHTPEQRQSSLLMTWLKSLTARWVGPNTSTQNVSILCFPLVPFVFLGAGTMCTYRCLQQQAREFNHARFMKQTTVDIGFMRENRNQWEGMEQLVKDLVSKVEKYQQLDQSREDRVNITLHEISDRLFNMRMSIDVYMSWLAAHNMFPANVSVPVLIGYESYSAINEVLSPQRRTSWLPWSQASRVNRALTA
eukprot:TRINITY_DN44890_c0_g1_i1.p1 TRINITY_DN44890_c0_g1~~TRINITY_DN44890_c0_g1_i1.p1  ORF type:complete len:381 (+),score=54.02 TRINITY_DN44890_c0_g1_i1:73-1215(+)